MNLKTVCSKGVRYADRKRIGRGPGSGLGKTSGRGHKGWGQRSGARRRPGYEGGQMPIYRRVPKRGFTNARFRTEYTVINVGELATFEDGANVDLELVLKHGLTSKVTPLFKVLGNGDLQRKLTVRAQKFSKSAVQKINAAGGTAVEVDAGGHDVPAEVLAARAEEAAKKSAKVKEAIAKAHQPSAAEEKPDKQKRDKTKGEKSGDKPPKGEKLAKGDKPPKGEKPKGDKSQGGDKDSKNS